MPRPRTSKCVLEDSTSGNEVVVVVNPDLQTDDCEADAITTAYFNINMVEVARTYVGYPTCTHLAEAY